MDRLEHALRHTSRRSRRSVAVLFVDLDNFKAVNDSLGHEVGDRLLVAVSERLRGCIRQEDTLARFGGDEFIVLLEEVEDPEVAIRVVERITKEFRVPIVLDGRGLFVRISIGVGLGASHTKSAEDLLKEADTAMYRAKVEGMDYQVFDPEMYLQAVNRLQLENDLRRAIEAEEFILHYQPIVNLESGDVRGVEALVRWNHPERGLLHPQEFVPPAEESGLIIPIDEQVLEEACRQAKEWQEEHLRAAARAVVGLGGQEPHLGVTALLAGVASKGVRQGGYAPEGHEHRSAHEAGTGGTLGGVVARRPELVDLAEGTNERVGP
jgi:diguanylate cyclase (GGDEF)-like protein